MDMYATWTRDQLLVLLEHRWERIRRLKKRCFVQRMKRVEAQQQNARLCAAVAAQDSRIADLEEDNLRLALLATNANLERTRLRTALGHDVIEMANLAAMVDPEQTREYMESVYDTLGIDQPQAALGEGE